MTRRDGHDIGRFLLSLGAFAAVAIACPAALVSISTARFGSANPLRGVRGGSSSSLTEPLADATVIDGLIRVSLCAAWVAVAVIVVTTVLEVVHMIRHRGLSMPAVRGIGWAQGIARFIAMGLLVVMPLTTSTTAMARLPAAATPHQAPTAVARPTETTVSPTAPMAAPASPTDHVVRPGESVYAIAEALAGGDGSRVIDIADAIVDANLGAPMGAGQRFTNPAYIEVGWVLQIPAQFVTAPPVPGPAVPGPADATTYEVQPGDTLWDIADEQLGDPTAWPGIWERNAGAPMDDGRTFDDPDLILPGWDLRLTADAPPVTVDEDVPASVEAAGDPSSVVDGADVGDVVIAPAADDPTDAPPSDQALSGSADADWALHGPGSTTTRTTTTTTTTTSPPAIGSESAGGGELRDDAPAAPSPVRLEHAALLAAGILALVAVRRRRRLRAAMPRHRVPEPRIDLVETERRLRSIDAGERALRVDVAVRAAARHLIESGAQIGWVEVSGDGDVDLRLTASAALPPPWSGTGQDWHLGAEVPVELLSDDARRVAMPCIALVQIGVGGDGAEVLVDLEACGALAVEARSDQADEVVSAIAAGLASSMYAEVAHLVVASLPVTALLGHRNAHTVDSAAAALELAQTLVGSTPDSERTTFELRSRHTGGEMWEPAIVLLGAADRLSTELPDPAHGVVVVASAGPDRATGAPSRLVGRAEGWTFEGFGSSIELTPIGVSIVELEAIDEVLTDAERGLESVELESVDELRWAEDEEPPVDPFVPMDHHLIVGLLGGVTVTDGAGTSASWERSKTVELIAWLATHRERSTRTGARTALWELDVRDATFANVVSEARRGLARLVAPPEGEEWVARTLTEHLPLHAGVVTDADLVAERLHHARVQPPAQALATLRPAVAMIRDVPFAGTSYLWPDAEGITSNLVLLAITAASEFAGHALSLGDTDGVFWATGQGLKVLPGHEELIGLRMRAHARAGDLAGVRQEWESYERILMADAWSDGEPAPKLLSLRRELLTAATGE